MGCFGASFILPFFVSSSGYINCKQPLGLGVFEMPGEAGVAAGRGIGGGFERVGAGVDIEAAFAAGDAGVEQFAAQEAFDVFIECEGDVRVFGAL